MSLPDSSTNLHAPAPPPQIPTSPIPPAGSHLPIQTSSLRDGTSREKDFARFAHYAAISCLVAVPVIIALPPRKLDFYTFTLLGCGVISGSHLVSERNNGRGVLELVGEKMGFSERQPVPMGVEASRREEGAVVAAIHRAEERAESIMQRFDLPTEKARETHESILAAEEAVRLRREGRGHVLQQAQALREREWGYGGDMSRMLKVAQESVREDVHAAGLSDDELKRRDALASAAGVSADEDSTRDRSGVKGVVKNVWYGDEDPKHWKEQRMKEEREAMEDGRGYGGLIMEQIWEVWNWDKEKNEDGDWVPKKKYEKKYNQQGGQ